MARPSPVPSNLRASLSSVWVNGVNSCSKPFGGMPMPLSVTLICMNSVNVVSGTAKFRPLHAPDSWPTLALGTHPAHRVTSPPSAVNLTAFDSRL